MSEPDGAEVTSDSEPTQLTVLPTPRPTRTGVPPVDAALDRLADLNPRDRPVDGEGDPGEEVDLAEHVAVYEEVHARLQEALSSTDSGH